MINENEIVSSTCHLCGYEFIPTTKFQYLNGICGDCISKYSTKSNKEVKQKMTKLNDFAKDFEPASKTKNIADLKEVSTDIDLVDDAFEVTDKVTQKVKTVKQKVIIVNSEKYRVPSSVIGQLKVILEDNPNCKKFKVKKSGTTMDDTRYQVIPIM